MKQYTRIGSLLLSLPRNNNYADEVASINVANVKRQIKAGGLLGWDKKKYSGGSSSSTSNLQCFLKLI